MGRTSRLEGTLNDVTTYFPPQAYIPEAATERLAAPEALATSARTRPGGQSSPMAAMTVARVIQSEEELRQRVAQRLHDGPTQSLANLVLTAEICERTVQSDPQRALSELAHLKSQVNEALQQTRAFIFELRPMTLDDLGLMPTLRRYAANMAAQGGLKITVQAPKGDPRLAADAETALFRVAQEGINNAVAHGKASEIMITVLAAPDHIRLYVDDNGGGFDVDEAIAWALIRGSTGIASMQERAEMLDGWLRIESARGQGTRIELQAPTRPTSIVNAAYTSNTPNNIPNPSHAGAPLYPPDPPNGETANVNPRAR